MSNETERRIFGILRVLHSAQDMLWTERIAELASYHSKDGRRVKSDIVEVRRILRELEEVGAVTSWHVGTYKKWGIFETAERVNLEERASTGLIREIKRPKRTQ